MPGRKVNAGTERFLATVASHLSHLCYVPQRLDVAMVTDFSKVKADDAVIQALAAGSPQRMGNFRFYSKGNAGSGASRWRGYTATNRGR